MKESIYKKVEYYLYNYKELDNIIEDIRERVMVVLGYEKKILIATQLRIKQ